MNSYTLEEIATIARGAYRASGGAVIAIPSPYGGDIELPAHPGQMNAGSLVIEWLKTWQNVNAGLKCLADKVELDTGSAIAYGVHPDEALAGVVEDIRIELEADWDL